MELIGGFLLWLADIVGIKRVSKERRILAKVLKVVVFLVAGFVAVVLFFTLKSV
jgi:uncharacterized membrane protein